MLQLFSCYGRCASLIGCLTFSVAISQATWLTSSLGAQRPPAVDVRGTACANCLLQARLVATIGSETDSVDVSFSAAFAYGASGNIFVGSPRMGRVFVYSAQGRLLRTIGRPGQGPGEFRSIRHIDAASGDTLYVVDGSRKLSVFAPSGAFVRSGTLPFSVDQMEVLADGKVAVAADIRTPALAGFPAHLLDRTGKLLRSFGKQEFLVDPAYPGNLLRKLAVSNSGAVWSANRTVLEQWDTAGKLTKIVQRHTTLMPLTVTPIPSTLTPAERRSDVPPPARPATKPGSGLIGVQFDSGDRMWTAIITGADDWNSRKLPPGSGIATTPDARDQLMDTVIDVLDVERGIVLASYRLPFGAWKMPAPGIVFRVRDAQTHNVLEVWRLELRTP